jgi:hypothetical protein
LHLNTLLLTDISHHKCARKSIHRPSKTAGRNGGLMGYALHQCIWGCDKEAEHRAPWLDSSVLHRVLLSMDIIWMFKKQKMCTHTHFSFVRPLSHSSKPGGAAMAVAVAFLTNGSLTLLTVKPRLFFRFACVFEAAQSAVVACG